MFIDTRNALESSIVESDLCIVGGGIAGLTLALHFDGKPLRVCVLESGGLSRDDATQALYRGENVGLPYARLDTVRSRYLGGSSNCWGGWCRPFDAWDFEQRDWIPHGGWPFGKQELLPHYLRAHQLLGLGDFNYDPLVWSQRIAHRDVVPLPLDKQHFDTQISQFSPPLRFGREYREQLRRSKNIHVWLHANACELITKRDGRQLQQVNLRTLSGRSLIARSRFFVLAAGGIENARLLLLSHQQQAAGLGNQHDLVGRFFMEHPRVRIGSVHFNSPRAARFYDVKYNYHSRHMRAQGVSVAAHLAPAVTLQSQQRLLNTRLYFASTFPGEDSRLMNQLRMSIEAPPEFKLKRFLSRKTHALLNYGYTRVAWPASLVKQRQLEIVVEPAPNPHSRVTLATERDALGLQRVRLDWRISELEYSTVHRLSQLLAKEFAQRGLGHIETPLSASTTDATQIGWCWHHMGTTRMHDDPRQGVVDRHCRVHGMNNLYIAGSSIFPTAGSDMPTLTITALACRLADRLEAQLLGSTRSETHP